MASCVMHIAVANEIYKKLSPKMEIDYYDFILGSIAPDIWKQIGKSKKETHFVGELNDGVPVLELFLDKYINSLNKSFELGYYVHLYTDKLFYLDFLPLFVRDDIFYSTIKCLDGSTINVDLSDRREILYNDYTNLNVFLIDAYNLNLKLFYTEFRKPKTEIVESYADRLDILIDNMGIIINNSSFDKNYVIDTDSIVSFIDDCVNQIYDNIKSLIIC